MSRSGWAVVDDKPNWALTEGAEWWDSVNSDDQDLYILAHGHDYKGALKEFSMISGSVPMFPRYALGVWVGIPAATVVQYNDLLLGTPVHSMVRLQQS